MNARILRVTQREYLAYVRTRTFLISALSLPITLVLAMAIPILLESVPKPPRDFTLVDETGRYADDVVPKLVERAEDGTLNIGARDYRFVKPEELNAPIESEDRLWFLQTAVQTGHLFAFFRLSAGDELPVRIDYYTSDAAAEGLAELVQGDVNRAVARQDLLPRIGDEVLLDRFLAGVPLRTHAVTEEGGEEATAAHVVRSYAPMAFVYLLWISVIMMAGHLMTSTIEEKTSRIIEVLLSSVSSFEFMFGKLVGLAAAGLTMLLIWIGSAVLAFAAIQSPLMQQIGMGIASSFGGGAIFWFLGFFLLGFLFFAAIFVGIGSVCNTIREAQTLTQPLMFILMVPLFLMVFVTSNPDHIVAVVATFIPPFTPFVIMNRIPANPPAPLWQVVLAAVLLMASTWGVIRITARVFRIGILMYGKPPSMRELVHWARQST